MYEPKKRKRLSKEEALAQLQKYCAYQDRCHSEVRTRLLEYQVYGDDLEEIISELIAEDFLNEERFARSYARGKFRIKKWGRIKIKQELKLRQISDYCIRKAMTEIDDDEYLQTLETIIERKRDSLPKLDHYTLRKKIVDFALRRGYEYEIISEIINN